MKKDYIEDIAKVADRIRLRVLEHSIKNNGGYLSQACSSAEIFASLYLKIMNLSKIRKPMMPKSFPGVPSNDNKKYFTGENFNGIKNEVYDRFFLSPTHYSLVLYAALIEAGRMHEDGLLEFNKDGSVVEMIGAEHSPGMEIMTGSLGQGISQAAGIAMGRKLKGDKGKVVIFMSDGECQSGQFYEAIETIGYHKLDNILVYVDINGYQCDGPTESVMSIEPFDKRLESFGIRVFRVDGHNIEALVKYSEIPSDGRPTFVLCDTNPTNKIPLLNKRKPKLHYLRFKDQSEKDEYKDFYQEFKQKVEI
ncbi:transketolase [Clostridium cylindrosporum]|uniref:Transketolase, N-terminal subunit n=1 Tax=Clostridium cylindrosporum DSM 605 TaxID=1121307 RepID=A0A0J8D9B2_CLOCY|nr:1-deoxy-D-xylulose-5-phosphate synthase N-terminal domain-containing protein [Clostridium cylindrosporum]KMT22447.1 transketolase, N-terminal subunit [Clostridium cylindrosporum DSM 605]